MAGVNEIFYPPKSGGGTQIASQVAVALAPVSSLSLTVDSDLHDGVEFEVICKGSGSGASNVRLRFNGDSSTNHTHRFSHVIGASAVGPSAGVGGDLGTIDPAGTCTIRGYISLKAGFGRYAVFNSAMLFAGGTDAIYVGRSRWTGSSATKITSLVFAVDSTVLFDTGSVVRWWRPLA
jgi:hypothetical protein